ncbi:MAG: ATP-binding protein, partial [Pseudomonadota bacterium]
RVVGDHEQMIELFLKERKSDLNFVTETYRLDQISDKAVLKSVFGNLQHKSTAFSDIGVFDEQGLHLAYHGPYELAGKIYKDAPWFQEVIKKGSYISDVFLGYRKEPHFVIAVTKKENGRTWVLRATIDKSLFSEVVEQIRIGKTGEAYILNNAGLFQTRRRSAGDLMAKDPDLADSLPGKTGISAFFRKDVHNETYIYVTSWLKDKDWLLVARQEKAEAFRDLTKVTYLVLLVAVLGGLLIVSIAFTMTGRIVKRIELLDTEKKALGQQLVVAGRLAEIGEMSAGFAHEINNPLQIIKSELTLTETILDDLTGAGHLEDSEDVKEIKDSLKQIKEQVDRCGGITAGLLKFARKKESKAGRLDLNAFLPESIRLVKKKASVEGISIEPKIEDDTPAVFADPAHLEQVIVNLLNNAIYAVVERHGSLGGEIVLTAGPGADGRVTISISDNGSGINPENMAKIFTPFFTTKPVGQGTGLGLSICYGIVTEMGGQMEVSSELGKGATFTIHLKQA